jgi:hypothetical protein
MILGYPEHAVFWIKMACSAGLQKELAGNIALMMKFPKTQCISMLNWWYILLSDLSVLWAVLPASQADGEPLTPSCPHRKSSPTSKRGAIAPFSVDLALVLASIRKGEAQYGTQAHLPSGAPGRRGRLRAGPVGRNKSPGAP